MADSDLTILEEIVLLLIDDSGSQIAVNHTALDYSIASAALVDLAFESRIDTDLDSLKVLDAKPTGNAALDRALQVISASDVEKSAPTWIETLAMEEAGALRELAVENLVSRGIVKRATKRAFGLFKRNLLLVVDDGQERAVKKRISAELLSDDIPDARDATLIALADSCGILSAIYSEQELQKSQARIEQLRKIDLIGRESNSVIREVEQSVAMAMSYMPR